MPLLSCFALRSDLGDDLSDSRPYWRSHYGKRPRFLDRLGPSIEDSQVDMTIMFYGRPGSGTSILMSLLLGMDLTTFMPDAPKTSYIAHDVARSPGMKLFRIPAIGHIFDYKARAAILGAYKFVENDIRLPLKAFYFVIDASAENPLDIVEELRFLTDIFGPYIIRYIRFVLNNWDLIPDDTALCDFQRDLSRLYSLFVDDQCLPVNQILLTSSDECIGQLVEDLNLAWVGRAQIQTALYEGPGIEWNDELYSFIGGVQALFDALQSLPELSETDEAKLTEAFHLDGDARRQLHDLLSDLQSSCKTISSAKATFSSIIISSCTPSQATFVCVGARIVADRHRSMDHADFLAVVLAALPSRPTWIRSLMFDRIEEDRAREAAVFASYVNDVDDLLAALIRLRYHGLSSLCWFMHEYGRANPIISTDHLDIVLRFGSRMIFTETPFLK